MKKLMLISSILILVLCSACSSSVVDSIGKDVEDTSRIRKVPTINMCRWSGTAIRAVIRL